MSKFVRVTSHYNESCLVNLDLVQKMERERNSVGSILTFSDGICWFVKESIETILNSEEVTLTNLPKYVEK